MRKNIVLCSDGTGNSGGKGRGTNVWHIFNAVDLNGHKWDAKKAPQVAFHDDGVGTQSNVLLKTLGGALGLGLKRNIRELYTFLAKNYDPGDRIFLFGFSRGAYTIRALGGLIAQLGIIDRRKYDDERLNQLAKEAVGILRRNFQRKVVKQMSSEQKQDQKEKRIETEADIFRREHCVKDAEHAPDGLVDIAFIGVWDTVDAYGFPFDHLADFWHYAIYPFRFPDMKLSDRVKHASQAIAIDDERHTFHPVLWDEDESTKGRVNQVWFAGVHSNVGGGYPKDGLAVVTLDWMMSEAEKHGLRFMADDRAHIRACANPYDKIYNSRSGAAVYYRYQPRDIGAICAKHHIESPKIHISAFQRIKSSIESYAPGNLPARFNIVGTEHESPAIDEDKSQLEHLALSIAAKMDKPLLEKVARAVYVRRFLHYALLGITLAVVIVAWLVREEEVATAESPATSLLGALGKGMWSVPEWLFDFLIKPFILYPAQTIPIVLGSLLALWGVGAAIRGSMHRKFAAFWRETFANLEAEARHYAAGKEPEKPKRDKPVSHA